MNNLYTKNGWPLQVSGSNIYSRSGKHVGHINGNKIYGPTGRYAGTIVGDRVVYRKIDSATTGSPSPTVRARRAGSSAANAAGSTIWGDEPDFAD